MVEGKSLLICGTTLDVDNFSEGLLCLSTSGNYTQVEILHREQLRKNHQL